MSFKNVLITLKNEREEANQKHDDFIQQLDLIINNVESMFNPAVKEINKNLPQTNGNHKKVQFDEIEKIIRTAKKTIHIDEICEIIGSQRGSEVSRISISMLISHHFRKFKRKSAITETEKHHYRIKK